jgi:D-alanyl-lipoteichoic acid acyltransferase DltB (MBOAT superfamily)
MAIALSSLFGFQFPVNFAHPYFTRDPAAFWRRWHISLSSWLRDYLYIGLGGSRGGDWMAARNLMLVMLLCGLWHGAGWSYVLFGAIHGVALIVWRIVGPRMTRIGEGLSGPIRLGVSVVCWAAFQYWYIATLIVFRSPDLSRMRSALTKYVVPDFDFHLAGMGLGTMAFYSTLTIIGLFSVLHVISWRTGGLDKRLARAPFPVMCGACVVLGTTLYLLWPNSPAPFIYFQF